MGAMRKFRAVLLGVLLAATSKPALATDPLVLFLLRMLRHQIAMAAAPGEPGPRPH
jgi:hypothetical protein